MGDVVDFQRYRESVRPISRIGEPSESSRGGPPAESAAEPDPTQFGWLVLELDPTGRAVRWFHPGLVAQLGYVPETPSWVFLDDSKQIRAWRSLNAGQVAASLARRELPEPELAMPFRN